MLGGDNDAHHVVAHAIHVPSVHEQFDSVIKKRKKGSRVVHVVALEEEGPIDWYIKAWYSTSAIYTSTRRIIELLTFKGVFDGSVQSGLHFFLVPPFVNVCLHQRTLSF
jgi:hypothetical protein